MNTDCIIRKCVLHSLPARKESFVKFRVLWPLEAVMRDHPQCVMTMIKRNHNKCALVGSRSWLSGRVVSVNEPISTGMPCVWKVAEIGCQLLALDKTNTPRRGKMLGFQLLYLHRLHNMFTGWLFLRFMSHDCFWHLLHELQTQNIHSVCWWADFIFETGYQQISYRHMMVESLTHFFISGDISLSIILTSENPVESRTFFNNEDWFWPQHG